MNETDLILIEKFQTNQLSASELNSFNQRRKDDSEFDRRVHLIAEIEKAHDIDASAFKATIKEIGSQYQAPEKSSLRYWLWGTALILGLLGISYLMFTKSTSKTDSKVLYAGNFEVYPNTFTNRGLSKAEANFKEAMAAYDSRDFAKANALFNSIEIDARSDTSQFYQGICLMELNQAEKAIQIFEQLKTIDQSNYQNQSRWYLALSHLKKADLENTRKELNGLISNNESKIYANKAKALLSKL